MRQLTNTIRSELGVSRGAPAEVVSPAVAYLFLVALWSVAWTDSLLICLLFYAVFLVVSALSKVNPFGLVMVMTVVLVMVLGSVLKSFLAGGGIGIDSLRVGLKAHLLFGAPAVVFSRITAIQHFFAWSAVLGGGLASMIVGMGRSIAYFPKVLLQTRDSYRIRGKKPLRNPQEFGMSLLGSVLHFARTYADAIEVRGVQSLRGRGQFTEPPGRQDLLLTLVSALLFFVSFR